MCGIIQNQLYCHAGLSNVMPRKPAGLLDTREMNKNDTSLLLPIRTSWLKNTRREIQCPLCVMFAGSQDRGTKITLGFPVSELPRQM